MAEVLRYCVAIQGPQDSALSEQIEALLADGWQLSGGVSLTTLNGHLWTAQALTKSVHVIDNAIPREPRMVRRPGKP